MSRIGREPRTSGAPSAPDPNHCWTYGMRAPPTQSAVTPTRRIACQSAKSRQPRRGDPRGQPCQSGEHGYDERQREEPEIHERDNGQPLHQPPGPTPALLERLAEERRLHSRGHHCRNGARCNTQQSPGRQRDELDEEDEARPVELNRRATSRNGRDRRDDQRALLPGEESQRRDARPGDDQPAIDLRLA